MGVKVIEGPDVTVKAACAKSVLLPVTRITYDPGATFPTVKLPLTIPVPASITQAGVTTTPLRLGLVILHVVSLNENPEPVTFTFVPI